MAASIWNKTKVLKIIFRVALYGFFALILCVLFLEWLFKKNLQWTLEASKENLELIGQNLSDRVNETKVFPPLNELYDEEYPYEGAVPYDKIYGSEYTYSGEVVEGIVVEEGGVFTEAMQARGVRLIILKNTEPTYGTPNKPYSLRGDFTVE